MKFLILLLGLFTFKLYAQSYKTLIFAPSEMSYEFKVDQKLNEQGNVLGYTSMVYFNYHGATLIKGDQNAVGTQKLLNNILSADSQNQNVRLVYQENENLRLIVYSGLVSIERAHISNQKEKTLENSNTLESSQKAIDAYSN